MGAQTSSSAQEKFWGSLLKKYGPTAARLAGHAIKAYMGLAQTSTTAVEKEKFLFAALAAAKLGYTAYKMFSLPQVANFKKAEHYMALSQTATSVQEKEKFLFAALAAAKLGYTAYKMFSLTQTNTATAAQTKWGFGSLLKKYGPTAARLAGKAISAYMGLSQTSKGTIKSRIGKLLKNCKALWKGVRPKCLKSIKKIHQCAVREGMAAARKAARNLSRFTAAGALVLQFGARVIRSEVKRT